jgi:hypothetical protein
MCTVASGFPGLLGGAVSKYGSLCQGAGRDEGATAPSEGANVVSALPLFVLGRAARALLSGRLSATLPGLSAVTYLQRPP